MSEISGIRPDIRYPAPTGYPVSGFLNGRISGKTAIRSIPTCINADYRHFDKTGF